MALAEGVARLEAPLLLFGEDGTGRESLARYIHSLCPGSARDLVKVDCTAALEGQGAAAMLSLLAHCVAKGSADGPSTLLFRDIGHLNGEAQEIVLDLLDPPHGRRAWRVIATSSRDLAAEVQRGRVRADLNAALSRIILYLPPLRQRRSDIPELVRHFLNESREEAGSAACRIDDEALVALWRYDWPGNVAELEAVVKSVALQTQRSVIRHCDLPPYVFAPAESDASRRSVPQPTKRFHLAS